MRFATITLPFLLLTAAALPATAQKATGGNKDRAVIASCMQEISKAYEAYEKLTEQERAKAEQPADASSCIGAASAACIEEAKQPTAKTEAACARRELAVWNNQLDSRLKAYLKDAGPKESEAMKKVNAAWQAYRDARCAYPALDNKDADGAATQRANCLLTMTAQHALWIDTRENN